MRAMISAAAESSGTPSSNEAVSEGKPASARPATASRRAVSICKLFMAWPDPFVSRGAPEKRPPIDGTPLKGGGTLVSRSCRGVARFSLIRGSQQHRPEVDGQLVDLSVECERHLIVAAHSRSGIEPDVEGLIRHLEEGDRVGLLAGGNDLAVNFEFTAAT